MADAIKRDDLDRFLRGFYQVEDFEDYCYNGLQVEGSEEIRRLVLGVSLNEILLDAAVRFGADALVVHHGFFGHDLFRLTGVRRRRVAVLLERKISLFGIHLPMDAHPELGHNAVLLRWMGAKVLERLGPGFVAENSAGADLDQLLAALEAQFPSAGPGLSANPEGGDAFRVEWRRGFQLLANGPRIPRRLAVVSGGSAGLYEDALSHGVEAFFCGEIKESVPAISRETATHFINLGHYRSEIPGVLALRDELESRFGLEARFVDVPNPI